MSLPSNPSLVGSFPGRVKKILDYHLQKNVGSRLVKVTTTRWYEIPTGTSTSPEELLKEWFENFPVTRSHNFRDGSLLMEYFNEDHRLVSKDEIHSLV